MLDLSYNCTFILYMCSFVTCTYRKIWTGLGLHGREVRGNTIMGTESLYNLQLVTAERPMVKSDALVRCVGIIASTRPIMYLNT
jgi:hypothetical protein